MMVKENKKKEQVIDECRLCGCSYWQGDLISAKRAEFMFGIDDKEAKKVAVNILICNGCKKGLDAHRGTQGYKPDHPWSFPTL